jgi:ubiquinone/menaquinone biosynthesis C-methylase UbiE
MATADKRFKVPKMEGAIARSYARQRRSGGQLQQYRQQAAELTAGLPDGADVLEVAPGPGYLTIELARPGRYRVAGLDISRTFIQIASDNAREAGVSIDFQHGDAERMPFADASFDLIVCQAAFKNFARPVTALNEMHRVLRPGGLAVIQDMSHDATTEDIRREVATMALPRFGAWWVRWTLAVLRLRALTPQRFRRLAAESAFRGGGVHAAGLGLEVRLRKQSG